MRGTTFTSIATAAILQISTHVPHAGHDPVFRPDTLQAINFNSRAPCGARRRRLRSSRQLLLFQLTCPMRGTTGIDHAVKRSCDISTHVPHAGHDRAVSRAGKRGERFQLTCPMRGTTTWEDIRGLLNEISTHVPHAGHDLFQVFVRYGDIDFNSRAPCGARPGRKAEQAEPSDFNSRAPCGARRYRSGLDTLDFQFQLTCPMRGTTQR